MIHGSTLSTNTARVTPWLCGLAIAAVLTALPIPSAWSQPPADPLSIGYAILHGSPPPQAAAKSTLTRRPFARVGGVTLTRPAKKVKAFAYHESLASTALRLRPRGKASLIDHPRFWQPARTKGPAYIVMASRGRGTNPASAIDIAIPKRKPVYAPATGRVISVTRYRLYCNKPDVRVIIRTPGTKRNVVLFHLDKLRVRKGDRVVAGETPLGIARVFRNGSAQYDSYIKGNHPHVHIEVGRKKFAPVPGCEPRPYTGRVLTR